MNQVPQIFDYLSYRDYLRDFYHAKKTLKSDYSYRVFTQMAQLSSPSHLKMVMDGERNLTHKTIPKYLKALSLKEKKESQYFELLVYYDQEKIHDQKVEWFEKIMEEKKKKGLSPLEISQFEFLSKWHYVAIYVLIDTHGFINDPNWIVSRLRKKVSKANVVQALETLKRLELIKEDEHGVYRQTNGALHTPDHIQALAVNNIHREMITLGLYSLDEVRAEEREFNATTLPIRKEHLPLIKKKLMEFAREINEMGSNDEMSTDIYQLNMQFFPLTKDIRQ